MRFMCSFLMFLARVCLSAIFLLAGVHKLIDVEGTAAYMAAKGIPANPYLYGAAFIEILGGLSLLIGYKSRFGALLLMLFLIPTTYLFHDFWNVQDATKMQDQMGHFFSNLAIFGGLLYVFSCGAGGCSLDGRCCQVRPPEGT